MSNSALAVANFLVDLDLEKHRNKPRLTNMALQKILYFAEGRYLASNDKPLFKDPIEAWDYGPVVPDVYHAFKEYGSAPIKGPASTLVVEGPNRTWRWVTPELPAGSGDPGLVREFLTTVFNDLGDRPATALMAASHTPGGPWDQVYRPGRRHVPIPPELMREYFSSHDY